MPDPKPRRRIGVPKPRQVSNTPFWWRVQDVWWGIAGAVVIGLLWLTPWLACGLLIWVAVEYGLPWIIDVVMDAVEQRD